MNICKIELLGATLHATGSGALWWPNERLLCVSDLHLGKSDRIARRSGALLPPYETLDTLTRLDADIERLRPATVICLGDSFDDDAAALALEPLAHDTLARMQAGRLWIWIEGNHDPSADVPGGSRRAEYRRGPLTLRHIAQAGAVGEISGHYHPKAVLSLRGKMISRPCFLADAQRIMLPAYGTYTGGLAWTSPVLRAQFSNQAQAILTGPAPVALPLPQLASGGKFSASTSD